MGCGASKSEEPVANAKINAKDVGATQMYRSDSLPDSFVPFSPQPAAKLDPLGIRSASGHLKGGLPTILIPPGMDPLSPVKSSETRSDTFDDDPRSPQKRTEDNRNLTANTARLHTAIRWSREDEVHSIIDQHPETVDVQDEQNGNTALHIAAQNNHVALVNFIVRQSCNVNAQNAGGQTCLHMAISYGLDEVETLLRRNGADESLTNVEGHPAKWGLGGENNPDSKEYKLEQFRVATTTQEILDALKLLKTAEGLEVSTVAKAALAKKKDYKEAWTPVCQNMLIEVMSALA